jgi:type II secretory pathway pseudopilin PulG
MTQRTIEVVAFLAAILVATLAFHAWLASHDEQQRLQSTLAAQKQFIDAADSRERARDASLNETLAQIEKLKRATQTPEQILRELPDDLRLPEPLTIVQSRSSNSAPETPKNSPVRQGTSGSKSVLTGSPGQSTSVFPAADNGSGGPGKLAPMPQPSLPSRNAAVCIGPESDTVAACPPRAFALGNPLQRPLSEPGGQSSGRGTPPPSPCANALDCSAQIPAADLKPLYNYVQDCRACQAELAAAKQNAADDAAKIAALTRERDAAITASKQGSVWRRLRRNALWFAVGAAAGYAAKPRP